MLFASGATLLFAVLGWAAIYGLFYWFTVAFLSVKEGLNFMGTRNFNRNFFSSVAVLYVATLLDRWMFRLDREAVDRRPFSETTLDVLLFLPRMTLAVFENFGVWVYLTGSEMKLAAQLVGLICKHGRFAMQEVPLVIQSERGRERILFALRVSLVVDVRQGDGVSWLYIGSLAPASLGATHSYQKPAQVRRVSGEIGHERRIG